MKLSELMAVGRAPDHPVAWEGNRLIVWAEFSQRVARLSRTVAARRERNWLLACADPLDFAVALFAVWHGGGRALLPPSLQKGVIEETRAQADAVLGERADWPDDQESAEALPPTPLDPVRCGLDLFTSGSSGAPKRVVKQLAQLDAEIATLERLWGGEDCGPVLATAPHHHIYGLLFRLLWPLAAGRPFDNQTCAAPELLLARLDRLGPGRVISSPSHLARMPELIPLESLAGRVTRLFSSGGPLNAATARRFQAALGEAPLEIFGSTETGGIAWRIQDGETHDAAWSPFPGVTVSVSDVGARSSRSPGHPKPVLSPVEGNESGGSGVRAGGALTLTSPFLPDSAPLITEDAAELLGDGRFRLQGRLDRVAKIEGKRLSLADMETRLAGHPWVREAALVVLNGRRQRLGAVLALSESGRRALADDGRAACARTLRQHLSPWFDAVLLPRQWRYPDSLPYNERGKLTVADLLRQFDDAAQSPGTPP